MSRQNKSIQEKLETRTPATMRQVIQPVDMLETEQKQQSERTNERSDEATEKRTFERKNERARVRHSFDIYHDQLLSLKEIALHRQKASGERVLLGELVQEALDNFITSERMNERFDERTFSMAQKIITLQEMQELAKRKGGTCLSETYITGKIKLLWECKQGHRWEATPAQVKIGRWCLVCAKARIRRWFNDERPR